MSFLVFGSRTRRLSPAATFRAVAEGLRGLDTAPAGFDTHARLVELFIETAELAQALVDRVFAQRQGDGPSAVHEIVTAAATALARAVAASWKGEAGGRHARLADHLDVLALEAWPQEVEANTSEGFAFYALFPEAYLEAARDLPAGAIEVIGIRSIGLALAALVAAAAQAAPPVTVRPVGHPFQRALSLRGEWRERLSAARGIVAVADEGPGLSGSSFGAVLDALETCGVPETRIHLLPSHAGEPGSQAGDAARRRWRRLPRHIVDFDRLAFQAERPAFRFERWFEKEAGAATGSMEEIGGGRWRSLFFAGEDRWPPALPWQERRKYRLFTVQGPVLLKFAGLGHYGRGKLAHARRLAQAGFTPAPLAFRHGFLAERWVEDAVPLPAAGISPDEAVAHLGAYLGFRARHFPADAAAGASTAELAAMLRHNAGAALGAAALPAAEAAAARLAAGGGAPRRIVTDNRLHLWEWLRRGDGRLFKTDALDHAAGHDLVGAQDVAWDVAGATVEFSLDDEARDALAERVGRESGLPFDRERLRALLPAYCAFQLGAAHMARDGAAGDPAEAARWERETGRYRLWLERALRAA